MDVVNELRLSGTKVLVVEDEYYQAIEVVEEIVRIGGSVAGPYSTTEEGVASLAAALPDCALIDINTGNGLSFTLADALLARGVPFAFLTGYDAGSIPERFGEVRRIEKPADVRTVMKALSDLRSS